MNKKVSVIIPVYNGERFVAGAIESVLDQTFNDIEIVVVNDGSTDNSEDKISPYSRYIKYIKQENGGIAQAYNTGLAYCTGEYIAFLEQDDIWLPRKTAMQIEYLESHPDVSMVHCRYLINEIDNADSQHTRLSTNHFEGDCFNDLFAGCLEGPNIIPFSVMMLRHKTVASIGEFNRNIKISVDYDFLLRLSYAHKIGHQREPLVEYRIHANNTSGAALPAIMDDTTIIESWATKKDTMHRLNKAVVKHRLLDLYSNLAWQYYSSKQQNQERSMHKKILTLNPLAMKHWINYIATFLGYKQRNMVRHYSNKLKVW